MLNGSLRRILKEKFMQEIMQFHKKILIKIRELILSTNGQLRNYDNHIPKALIDDHILELSHISHEMNKYIADFYKHIEALDKQQNNL